MNNKIIAPNNESNFFICSKCGKMTKHNSLNIVLNWDHDKSRCYYMVDINFSYANQYHILDEINQKNWKLLFPIDFERDNYIHIYIKICSECGNRIYFDWDSYRKFVELANQNMLNCDVDEPSEFLDDELTRIYNEARNIYQMSSRAAAALLRHILEEILKTNFPEVNNCTNLFEMLNSDVVKNKIGSNLVNVGNNIRIIANKLIHTNEIDMEQVDINMPKIFKWINDIVNVIYNDYSIESDNSTNIKSKIIKQK